MLSLFRAERRLFYRSIFHFCVASRGVFHCCCVASVSSARGVLLFICVVASCVSYAVIAIFAFTFIVARLLLHFLRRLVVLLLHRRRHCHFLLQFLNSKIDYPACICCWCEHCLLRTLVSKLHVWPIPHVTSMLAISILVTICQSRFSWSRPALLESVRVWLLRLGGVIPSQCVLRYFSCSGYFCRGCDLLHSSRFTGTGWISFHVLSLNVPGYPLLIGWIFFFGFCYHIQGC